MHPPPSYANSVFPPPPFNTQQRRAYAKLSALPPHLLLQVVYMMFPQVITEESPEVHRKILYWMATRLRLVNRSFYIACMHVLRSTYLPAYDSLIRPPYSSDPFPLSIPSQPFTISSSTSSPLRTIQRETQVLDLFIALKVREDVWLDDSELHLEREESFKDLFDLVQPRSRLEDLIRKYGEREGVVTTTTSLVHARSPSGSSSSPTSPQMAAMGGSSSSSRKPLGGSPSSPPPPFFTSSPSSSSSSTRNKNKMPAFQPVQFSLLSIQFSSRKVGLQMMTQGRKRTIVEVARSKETKLEVSAKQLVGGLARWLSGS